MRKILTDLRIRGYGLIAATAASLDTADPAVHQQIEEAALRMHSTFLKARDRKAAEDIRNLAVKRYRCRPEIFPPTSS